MITDFLYAKGTIKNSEKEIYQYGYILILDGLLDTIVLLLYGLIIHKFLATVLFILVFTTARMFSGGYHARSRWQCILITFISCFISINYSESLIGLFERKVCLVIGLVICYVIFILFAPIENSNKPLEEEDIQINKIKSLVLLSLYAIIIAVTSIYNVIYSDVIFITLMEVTLFMIIGIIIQGRKRHDER